MSQNKVKEIAVTMTALKLKEIRFTRKYNIFLAVLLATMAGLFNQPVILVIAAISLLSIVGSYKQENEMLEQLEFLTSETAGRASVEDLYPKEDK